MADIPPAEVTLTPGVVSRLVARQCPAFAGRPVAPFAHGWDNELFTLGPDLLVRLPRRRAAALLIEHEAAVLPGLSPALSASVPVPLFVGEPEAGYPWRWSIVPRLSGRLVADLPVESRAGAAADLGAFLAGLHRPAPSTAPVNPFRGMEPARRRAAWEPRVLAAAGPAAWRTWLRWAAAPSWPGPAVWVHGDPHPLNLLVTDHGRLAGVLDWGDVTRGDPAGDLGMAWLTFEASGLAAFQQACDASGRYDAAVWDRARAWALGLSSVFVLHSDNQPALGRIGRHGLAMLDAER